MDSNNKPKLNVPLAGELPETKLPEIKPEPAQIIDLNEPKDYSHLPTGTQASIQLDKKNVQPTLSTATESVTNNNVSKGVLKIDYSKKFFRIALGIFGAFVACFILFLILSLTNLDTAIVKINLNGRVTDVNTGEPIKNASILVNNIEVAKTNDNGLYSAPNTNFGEVQVTVRAEGYDELTETVKVTKVLLDYSTRKDFTLKSSLTGVLSGKLIPTTKDYKFTNDQLFVGDKQFSINDDGTFNINNIKVGEIKFKFASINFKDIEQSINLLPGTNKIPDITLVIAGDIVGELKSYIKEDLVLNTKFFVENILQDQVNITESGNFTVKDLDASRKYKIRVVADGYKTRDYEINISQGENQLFNFKLVENGSAYFFRNTTENSNSPVNLFSSDFDGQNLKKISEDTRIDAASKFFSIEEQNLYFQSTISDAFKKTNGANLNMPYLYSLSSSVAERMTIDTSNLLDIKANFVSKKMLNVFTRSNPPRLVLQVMNLDGTNRKDVVTLETTLRAFEVAKISNNGEYVFYSSQNGNQTEIFRFNINSNQTTSVLKGESVKVFDISNDGNLILASRKNQSTGLVDLVLVNIASDDLRTLKENIKGFDYQFVKGNNNKIVFFERKESRWNIFTFTIDQSQEEKITSLTPDYEISDIYQESNLLFYVTNRGLLVLDIEKPKNFKLVTDNVYKIVQ